MAASLSSLSLNIDILGNGADATGSRVYVGVDKHPIESDISSPERELNLEVRHSSHEFHKVPLHGS